MKRPTYDISFMLKYDFVNETELIHPQNAFELGSNSK